MININITVIRVGVMVEGIMSIIINNAIGTSVRECVSGV